MSTRLLQGLRHDHIRRAKWSSLPDIVHLKYNARGNVVIGLYVKVPKVLTNSEFPTRPIGDLGQSQSNSAEKRWQTYSGNGLANNLLQTLISPSLGAHRKDLKCVSLILLSARLRFCQTK